MKFDFLIVGCGFFGATFARVAAENNKKVLLVEKRNHIGGNCYSEKIEGINVHKYGPHIFHTNDKKIWNFVNRFSEFNNYQHKIKVNYKDKIYSFPINLMTFYQIWGLKSPKEALDKIESVKINSKSENLEDWAKSQVGEELYEIFIKGYTTKQWNKSPKDLPTFIIKRIPIRLSYDDRYFNDKYQGIPVNGYTAIFEKMLDHPNIKLKTNVDFFNNKHELEKSAKKIVYTGKIDEFYEYRFGELEYRSLRFENKIFEEQDYQGSSIINFTEEKIPYTRVVEHKHFEYNNSNKTVVTWEYPDSYCLNKIPYYPINDEKNNNLYKKYEKLGKNSNIIFGGRLGKYEYKDMHQIIASAIVCVNKNL